MYVLHTKPLYAFQGLGIKNCAFFVFLKHNRCGHYEFTEKEKNNVTFLLLCSTEERKSMIWNDIGVSK